MAAAAALLMQGGESGPEEAPAEVEWGPVPEHCPVSTVAAVSSAEAALEQGERVPELRAYKLGKKKCSYNQVQLTLTHPTDASQAPLSLREAFGAGDSTASDSVHPGLAGSTLVYNVHLTNARRYHIVLHLVHAEPDAEPTGPGGEIRYHWRPIRREHCGKGCQGPILRAIQRFGKLGRRSGPSANSTAQKRGKQGGNSLPPEQTSPAANLGPDGTGEWKTHSNLFVAIDEACTHVTVAGRSPRHCRFRLLACVYEGRTCNNLVSSAVSAPIRVLANNDVPGGAAFIDLKVPANLPAKHWAIRAEPTPLRPSAGGNRGQTQRAAAALKEIHSNSGAATEFCPTEVRSHRKKTPAGGSKCEAKQITPEGAAPKGKGGPPATAGRLDAAPHALPVAKRVRLDSAQQQEVARRLSGKFAAATPGATLGGIDPQPSMTPEQQQAQAQQVHLNPWPAQVVMLPHGFQQALNPHALAYLQSWNLWYTAQMQAAKASAGAAGAADPKEAAAAKQQLKQQQPSPVIVAPTAKAGGVAAPSKVDGGSLPTPVSVLGGASIFSPTGGAPGSSQAPGGKGAPITPGAMKTPSPGALRPGGTTPASAFAAEMPPPAITPTAPVMTPSLQLPGTPFSFAGTVVKPKTLPLAQEPPAAPPAGA